MAIWGDWHNVGGNGLRVGADYSYSAVDTNSGQFWIHYWFYVQSLYNYSGDVQWLNYAGCLGGSDQYTLNSGHGGITLVAEHDCGYNYSTWGSSPGNIDLCFSVSGAYNGSTPGLCLYLPIPARPYAAPNNPSNVNAWMDVGQTSASITWDNNPTAQRPPETMVIQHQTWGVEGWSGWYEQRQYGTTGPNGAVVWDGLATNKIHTFRLIAANSAGYSGWVDAPWVYFPPAAPTGAASQLDPAQTITTTWTNNHYSGQPFITYRIERSVNGGVWTQVVAGLAEATTTWTDPTPGAGPNQYRVKAYLDKSGGISSAWSTGNIVSTIVPPLAPTLLSPNGVAIDTNALGVTLTWQHNHGGDSAPQSHYTIEKSNDGGANWTALAGATNVASTTSSHTVAAGVLANANTWLWKVKTQGNTGAAFGPFSSAATITAKTTPVVGLDPNAPADPTVQLPLLISWVFSQAQGDTEAEWVADLYAADNVTLLEHRGASDSATSTVFTYPLIDQDTYWVRVRAKSTSGQWSNWVSAQTTIDLPPPADVTLTAFYQPCTGVVQLALVMETPQPGEVLVDTVVVERSINGGPWVVLIRGLTLPNTILDTLPITNGLNEYRVTAVSLAPSVKVMPAVQCLGTDGAKGAGLWVFLSYGAGFGSVLRVHSDLDIDEATSRVGADQAFRGRRKSVALFGENRTREVKVSATLAWRDLDCLVPEPPGTCRFDSPPTDWTTAGQEAGMVCYRDFTGRRVFGRLTGLSVKDGMWPGNASVGFQVAEDDYTEAAGVLVP